MTPAALQGWRAETVPFKKARLLNALVAGESALIERCARKLARKEEEMDDLRQCGRMGVLKAIEKYDPSRGAWVQYARQWIFDSMNRGVVMHRDVARTTAAWSKKKALPKKVRREAQRIEAVYGRKATAADLGVSEEVLEAYASKPVIADLTTERVLPEALTTVPSQTILTPAFWRALASLTEIEAKVMLAIVLDERQVKEVAKAEGHEERWATSTYRRAVEKMRAALAVGSR